MNRPFLASSITEKKSQNLSELSITCSKMHPESDSIFAFGLNTCELSMCDIRVPSGGNVISFGMETRSMKNFFTDMVYAVGDIDFLANGKYIIAREYLSVKIWDIANNRKPVQSICVQESLKSKLVNLFETDSIFDKFGVATNKKSNTVVTGNYNNFFHILDINSGRNCQYELNFNNKTICKEMTPANSKNSPLTKIDTRKKTNVVDYHP